MRFKTNTLIFCFLLVGLTLLAQKQERPNVLFIIVDDLNDYVGYLNGHNQSKTPNIDNLSSSAVNFKNAHSNVPVCQPSRNSLFTGILPHRSKDFGWTPGRKVNLERSLRLGDELGGHIVTGHIDGTGSIEKILFSK